MAYIKIEQNRKGLLQAKIQVSGKDAKTGETKTFSKRVYNSDNLSEAKFRKQVEKQSIEFEDAVAKAYRQEDVLRSRVLTFMELMTEWQASIKANLSVNYYVRAKQVAEKFNAFLFEQHLADRPISDITVRDVQMFFNTFTLKGYISTPTAKAKKDFPKVVNFRELARQGIITRYSSYGMKHNGNSIELETAKKICEYYNLDFDEYFEEQSTVKQYAPETIKGYRRVLRTLFNEAVRYEWITKNPVCATKIGAGSSNTSLREVPEKEVFSLKEAQAFLKAVDAIPNEQINKRIPLKFMLLTGVRIGELNGLRWSDIDVEKRVVHIRRNRLYTKEFGTYEKDPKTKTSKRDIPLPDALVEDLHQYKEWFINADDNFENKLDSYYLASNIYREPIAIHTVGRWLKELENENNLKRVTCHGLRHTYCSLLLSQNVPIQTVSKYMGHSDSTVTLKVYSHFIPDTQEKVMSVINSWATS